MQHLTLKATTTTTDQELGTFTAVVSAWDADREGDVIERDAFYKTTLAWQASGKKLPLLFEHSTTVVGALDPYSMRSTDAGLVVSGEVDRETDEGLMVWRTIKAGTAGFSIGFMSKSKPRKGGGRTLTEIDLLEVSATSTPMHPSARVLDWKSSSMPVWTEADSRKLDRLFGSPAFVNAGRHKDEQMAKDFEEVLEKAEKEEKRDRPIQIKRFEV
jgi:HK97 family phage prohead protease